MLPGWILHFNFQSGQSMLGKREKEHKWKHVREDVLQEKHLDSSDRVVLEVNFHVLRSIDIENALSEGQ